MKCDKNPCPTSTPTPTPTPTPTRTPTPTQGQVCIPRQTVCVSTSECSSRCKACTPEGTGWYCTDTSWCSWCLPPTPTPTRTPTPTPTLHPGDLKWKITMKAVCQTPSKVLKPETKLRMFRILWPWVNPETGRYSPWDFNCRVDSEEGNNSSTHFMEIKSEYPLNNTQNIYVGLELPVRNNKKAACSEGVAFEPYEITPSVPNICRNIPQSGDYICFGKFFNPYNFMAMWSFNRLTPGDYTIKVRIPDEYCELPPRPNVCPTKTKGDANCDGKIDGIDYSMWLNRQCTTGCSTENKKADFNDDGKVNDDDYSIWFNNRV